MYPAGTVADGAGLVWLVAVTGTAIQRYTLPRLQGRATAAWTMTVLTPRRPPSRPGPR
jgi:hypothetical protein